VTVRGLHESGKRAIFFRDRQNTKRLNAMISVKATAQTAAPREFFRTLSKVGDESTFLVRTSCLLHKPMFYQ
jgi:hypothetical protein